MKKQEHLNFYTVSLKYIRELSKADSNVMSVSPQLGKETRPFVGVVIIADNKDYCIPLTSPNKDKFKVKSKEDFIKIPHPTRKDQNGAPKILGILNLNNMIPISDDVIYKIDLTDNSDIDTQRRNLLMDELAWCRDNADVIVNRANKLYKKVTETPEKSRNLTRRCCDFKKLETVLQKWLEKKGNN